MLGDKIGELTGQQMGVRILPGDDFRYVKMEVTFQQEGTVLGLPVNDMGTFVAFERNGGQIYAEGQGITMSSEGEGALWKGHGVGHPTGEGMGMSIRFSIGFQAQAGGKLGALNGYLVIGEFEADAQGKVRSTIWEWK